MNHVVEHLASEHGLPVSEVERQLSGWESHSYLIGGIQVGTAMLNGTEIHFALDPKYHKKAMKRGPMRAAIKPLFDRLGFLTTRILIGHTEQERFIERVGFEKTWSDGRFNYYLLANLPYERKAK